MAKPSLFYDSLVETKLKTVHFPNGFSCSNQACLGTLQPCGEEFKKKSALAFRNSKNMPIETPVAKIKRHRVLF